MPPSSVSYQVSGALDAAVLAAALAPAFGLQAQAPVRRSRSFYDTFDGGLHATGQVVVHEAGELLLLGADELPVARAPAARAPKRLRLDDLAPGPLATALGGPVGVRALLPLVRVGGREQQLRVLDRAEKTVVRLVLEQPRVDGGDRLATRLRVVPVRGYEKAAAKVTALLEAALTLTAAPGSVCEEAVRSTGGAPGGVSSSPRVPLEREEAAGPAAARICRRLLEVIEANLPGTLADIDSEFLHDLRVAVRRTRALQRELRGAFPAAELAHWRAEFRWLQAVTGPTRDLDVYVEDFEDFAGTLPPARRGDLEPLRALLVRRRLSAQRRMRTDLRSARTTALLRDWSQLLAAMAAGDAGGPLAREPVGELASARIAKVHRQMVKAGHAIDDATPAVALHDLRKKGKELRYLLEFFAPLYPPGVSKPLVSSLKALQDTLGRFQDREVQADLVASLADEIHRMDDAAAALMAMGLLVERLNEQQHQARAEFAERFAAFAAPEQRAVVRESFG